MRRIVHLSDLHFGKVDAALLEPLARRVHALEPDVVVVSGDLTQRAKPDEFRAAKAYLARLPGLQIVVPGNHDVPLYNVFQRFFQPLRKYKRFIAADLEPTYFDDELAVVGVNTARSLVFKGGRINDAQVERVRTALCGRGEHVTKVVVTHHPFDVPEHEEEHEDQIVGGAADAMRALARCGADLLLSGHLHKSSAGETTARYRVDGISALVVQAGTATSTRGRGEENSFNLLEAHEGRRVVVERYAWNAAAGDFQAAGREAFEHSASGWDPAA